MIIVDIVRILIGRATDHHHRDSEDWEREKFITILQWEYLLLQVSSRLSQPTMNQLMALEFH